MEFLKRILAFFQNGLEKLTGEKKRLFILVCTAILAVLLIFSVIMSIVKSGKKELPFEPERLRLLSAIPAEELFLPDEPDFLPEVILQRERRTNWTEQDASEYWQDPLRLGEEQWRDKIESAIDEFLERVP